MAANAAKAAGETDAGVPHLGAQQLKEAVASEAAKQGVPEEMAAQLAGSVL